MKLTYIKVFTDFVLDLEPLTDEEVGRLFRAMLKYAADEQSPALAGNERFVWGTASKGIDKEREEYARICDRNRANILKRYESTSRTQSLQVVTKSSSRYQEEDEEEDEYKRKDIREKTDLDKTVERFKEFRKKMKSPMTDYAVELMMKKLDRLASTDEEKIAILNQSIINGYKGIFPLKEDRTKTGRSGMGSKAGYKQTEMSEDFFNSLMVQL